LSRVLSWTKAPTIKKERKEGEGGGENARRPRIRRKKNRGSEEKKGGTRNCLKANQVKGGESSIRGKGRNREWGSWGTN